MDTEESENQTNRSKDKATNEEAVPVGIESEGSKKKPEESPKEDGYYPEDDAERLTKKFIAFVREERTFVTQAVQALTSVALVVVTIGQLAVSCNNAKDTAPLVDYARQTTEASKRSATAAESFSGAAVGINQGMQGAVLDLGTQVGKMDRLAQATETANTNTINAGRPWFGIVIEITDFVGDKVPNKKIVIKNSGTTPALITGIQGDGNFFEHMPKDPPFSGKSFAKGTLLVPGFVYEIKVKLFQTGKLENQVMDMLNTGNLQFFSYAIVSYIDLRTRKEHFTKACVTYVPATPTTEAQFVSCDTYNDGS